MSNSPATSQARIAPAPPTHLVGSTRNQMFLGMPVRRPAFLRPGKAVRNQSGKPRHERTYGQLAHVVGDEVAVECVPCSRGNGPFVKCVTVVGQFHGACTNCVYEGRQRNCNLFVPPARAPVPNPASAPQQVAAPPPALGAAPSFAAAYTAGFGAGYGASVFGGAVGGSDSFGHSTNHGLDHGAGPTFGSGGVPIAWSAPNQSPVPGHFPAYGAPNGPGNLDSNINPQLNTTSPHHFPADTAVTQPSSQWSIPTSTQPRPMKRRLDEEDASAVTSASAESGGREKRQRRNPPSDRSLVFSRDANVTREEEADQDRVYYEDDSDYQWGCYVDDPPQEGEDREEEMGQQGDIKEAGGEETEFDISFVDPRLFDD